MTDPLLVQWFGEADADALRDDGIHNFSSVDFATLSNVCVAESLDDAKRLIESSLVSEGIWSVDDDEQVKAIDDIEPGDFVWEQQLDKTHMLSFRGALVAAMRTETLKDHKLRVDQIRKKICR